MKKTENMPKHVGIIMDGNGRWAEERGKPRSFGHQVGAICFLNRKFWKGQKRSRFFNESFCNFI